MIAKLGAFWTNLERLANGKFILLMKITLMPLKEMVAQINVCIQRAMHRNYGW